MVEVNWYKVDEGETTHLHKEHVGEEIEKFLGTDKIIDAIKALFSKDKTYTAIRRERELDKIKQYASIHVKRLMKEKIRIRNTSHQFLLNIQKNYMNWTKNHDEIKSGLTLLQAEMQAYTSSVTNDAGFDKDQRKILQIGSLASETKDALALIMTQETRMNHYYKRLIGSTQKMNASLMRMYTDKERYVLDEMNGLTKHIEDSYNKVWAKYEAKRDELARNKQTDIKEAEDIYGQNLQALDREFNIIGLKYTKKGRELEEDFQEEMESTGNALARDADHSLTETQRQLDQLVV